MVRVKGVVIDLYFESLVTISQNIFVKGVLIDLPLKGVEISANQRYIKKIIV